MKQTESNASGCLRVTVRVTLTDAVQFIFDGINPQLLAPGLDECGARPTLVSRPVTRMVAVMVLLWNHHARP